MGELSERDQIVAWIRRMSAGPTSASFFSWRDRLFYAWWGLRNPSVSMVAARIAIADGIERGDHLLTPESDNG